jgi:hypothetical protein
MQTHEFSQAVSDLKSFLFVPSGVGILGIGERNTVSNGPDDGTLNKDATSFWNCLRHGNSTQMADNLAGNTTERLCNVGGHGNTGFFETGAGQTGPWDTNQFVYLFNAGTWGPQLQRIAGRYAMMTIWACHTGEGQDGADLVFQMSQFATFPVRATNGYVYTDGTRVWLEANAVWVTATPTAKPSPVNAPTPHPLIMRADQRSFIIDSEGKSISIPLEKVSRVEIERYSITRDKQNLLLSGEVAQMFVWRLLYTEPFELPGQPMAFITAKVTLTFDAGEGQETRTIIVYNDRLAYDAMSKKAYYTRPGQLFVI